MIVSIAHKGLKLFWEKDNPSKLPPLQLEKIRRILMVLDTIKTLDPLRKIPGYRLHALAGNLKGFGPLLLQGIIVSFLDLKMRLYLMWTTLIIIDNVISYET